MFAFSVLETLKWQVTNPSETFITWLFETAFKPEFRIWKAIFTTHFLSNVKKQISSALDQIPFGKGFANIFSVQNCSSLLPMQRKDSQVCLVSRKASFVFTWSWLLPYHNNTSFLVWPAKKNCLIETSNGHYCLNLPLLGQTCQITTEKKVLSIETFNLKYSAILARSLYTSFKDI